MTAAPRIVSAATIAAIVSVAVWLRLAGSLDEPLWLDEAYSAYAAGKGWAFLWRIVPLYETHPPFYYSLLRLWTLAFGDGLGGLRSLGLAAGLATLPVVALAASGLAQAAGVARRPVALAAAGLAALAPVLIEMSREVRPYPVMILAYAVAILCLGLAARRVPDGGRLRRGAWAGYVAALALVLWLHNLGPLFGAALGGAGLALVARRNLGRGEWALFLGGHLLAALLYLPAFLILLDQAPTWIRSTWLTFDWADARTRLPYLWGAPGRIATVSMAALAGLGLALLARAREGWRWGAALLLLAGLPVALALAISATVAPVFIIRTMTPVMIPAALLMGLGLAGMPGRWRLLGLLAGALLARQMVMLDLAQRHAGPMQDWYRALHWLQPRFEAGDMVYAYPNEGVLPFGYAARDLGLVLPVRPIPTAVPSLGVGGWNPTGSRGVVSLRRPQLAAIAAHPRTGAVRTVWLLRLGPWAYDKGDLFLRELARGRRVVGRYRNGPIDIVGLRRE